VLDFRAVEAMARWYSRDESESFIGLRKIPNVHAWPVETYASTSVMYLADTRGAKVSSFSTAWLPMLSAARAGFDWLACWSTSCGRK
jgi:hypothetical protein